MEAGRPKRPPITDDATFRSLQPCVGHMSAQGQAGNQSGVLGLTRRVADRQGGRWGRDERCERAFGPADAAD